MPRRRVDKVIEHRISLSDFERTKINEIIETQEANVKLDAVTDSMQAVGSALAGGGVLLAAGVFMLWKAPTLIVDVVNKVEETVRGPIDDIADFVLPSEPIALRREAQRLAKVRGNIASQEANYCVLSSGNYDAAECSNVQVAKDNYFVELEALRQAVRDSDTGLIGDSIFALIGGSLANFVYKGLGDIDPNFGNSVSSSPAMTPEQQEYYNTLTAEQKTAYLRDLFG
jgi:hypothetical protein